MKQKLIIGLSLCVLGGNAFAQPQSASEPQLLLKSTVGLMAPVWSPTGSKIAVTTDNYAGILVANADGTNLIPLTDESGAGYKMQWSADGNQILSRTNIVENARVFHEVKVWNVESGKSTTLVNKTRDLKGTPTWKSVANISIADRIGTKSVNTNTLAATASTPNVYDIMVNDPVHATAKIQALKQFANKMVLNPAISPNGEMVAFQIPGHGIYTCNINGDNLKHVCKGTHPAWLPDNESLIFTRESDNGHVYTASDIYAINTVTEKMNLLTGNTSLIPLRPTVSPDGTKVAFENAADASIYIINLKY